MLQQLKSDPKNICEVDRFVAKIAEKYKLSEEVYANLLISLTEAVNNAIIHGNCQDCSKTVSIKLRRLTSGLAVRVSDQGPGFDYRQLPDPTAPENIAKPGGRGVFLMNQLCDKMQYQDNGSTVEMRFNLR